MAVVPTSFAMELGLGGSFRQQLIDEEFVVAVWPLSELASSTARDITGNNNHGTFNGTGFTRGVTVPLPEGALGLDFDGNGFIEVADDSALNRNLNLSLANGDVDIAFLIKTSTSDATNRAIVQKMVTDAAGDGYSVSLQSGAIRWREEIAGVEQFNFARGSIADGNWHLVHCNKQTLLGTGESRIFIDGVQSGATQTGTSAELDPTAANFRIGCWNDGSGDFIGTLAFVMIGREGNGSLATPLQAARSWTDVTADVRGQAPVQMRRGIPGTGILDNTGRPSTLTFAMDNSEVSSGGVGFYSPGHTNCRAGFTRGIPARWSITYNGTTFYLFRGRIDNITPVAGINGSRQAFVTAVGWLDVAASMSLGPIETQTNIDSDELIQLVLDQAEGRSPAAVDISFGSSTFISALDVGQPEDSLLSELARVTNSERGFLYERGDTAQGGTLRWEGRADRQVATGLDATFSNTMHGLDVQYDQSFANIIKIVVTPRRVDSAPSVLFDLEISQQSQLIAPMQTVVFEEGYRSATNAVQRVGGSSMTPPVAGTDYAFWANSDGTGSNLNASLDVVALLGGSSFRVEFTNTGSTPGYLRLDADTAFQLRGTAVFYDKPVTVVSMDRDSVRQFGPRTVTIDMQYESSVESAQAFADFYLSMLTNQLPVPTRLDLRPNQNNTLMIQALTRDVGDKIGIVEPITGLVTDDPDSDADIGYFINEVQHSLSEGGVLKTTWSLAPSVPSGNLWLLGTAGASELDETTVLGL
jgi:hypothetical protein